MATATLQHPTSEQLGTQATQAVAAPLLVATDATAGSDAALRAARAIAVRSGQAVKLLAVYPPMPAVAAEVAVASLSEADQRNSLEIAIADQMERLGIADDWRVGDTHWTLDIALGDPAATIAATAKRLGAELVIMGLGGHELFDRIFGDELVIKVLRLGQTPVLAVASSFHALPLHALAAMDFSASGDRALALGARLVVPSGRITLAHVRHDDRHPAFGGDASPYVGPMGQAFDRLIVETEVEPGVRFERVLLSGDPAQQLLQLSQSTAPDLIIAGSHGHGFLTRLMIGSVSTQLVRKSRRSILVAPPIDSSPFTTEVPERGRFEFFEWAERLEDFSRRNAGRLSIIEVIDPKIGAQVEERGARFMGATYDPRDGCVHIMCVMADGHLTRSITGVTAIQVLRDTNGADAFLRVAHGRGQTLLTLER